MANRKLNHNRRILGRERIAKFDLTPGMFIEFNYRGKQIKDGKPLVLLLGLDNKNNLMHCININYLYEADVQNLFKKISQKTPIIFDDDYDKAKTNVRMESARVTFSKRLDGYDLYSKIIRPVLFGTDRTKNCYRTYKINKITNLNLVSYKLDVVEAQVRDDVKVSKYALKSAELFKNLIEQKAAVKTDNIRTKSQSEIRKDEQ